MATKKKTPSQKKPQPKNIAAKKSVPAKKTAAQKPVSKNAKKPVQSKKPLPDKKVVPVAKTVSKSNKKAAPVQKKVPQKTLPAKVHVPAGKTVAVKKVAPPKQSSVKPAAKRATPAAAKLSQEKVGAKKTSQTTAVKSSVPAKKKTSLNKAVPVNTQNKTKSDSAKSPKSEKPLPEKKSAASKKTLSENSGKKSKNKGENRALVKKEPDIPVISVPRDVKPDSRPKILLRHKAAAYSPIELEQLLFQRGVTNMNIFNPNAVPVAHVKKPTEKKIILTTLPKSTANRTVGAASMADLFGFDPFAKNAVSEEEKQIPQKWIKFYRKLMDRKKELQGTIARHSENAFRKEGKEETGDVSAYSQHTADIDNEAFDRDFAISRLATEQEELAEINIAVSRMKNGTYGICEITGKPIPAERLNKVPFTRYSIEGKLKAEEQRRAEARRRRANITGDISEIIDIENDAPITLSEEREEP